MQEDSRYTTERLAPEVVPQPQTVATQPVRYQRNRIFAYLLIGVGLTLLVRNLAFGGMTGMMGSSGHHEFQEPLGSAERVHLYIDNGNGNVMLSPNSDDRSLLSGDVSYHGQLVYDVGHDAHDRTVRLGTRESGWFGFGSSGTVWHVSLNTKPTYDVQINTGNSTNNLDLSRLHVEQLDVNTGNGRNELQLPAQGAVAGTIETGNGTLVISLPPGRAARLHIQHGNGRLRPGLLNGSSVSGNDGTYQTLGFDNVPAQNRIDLRIEAGNGDITVQ